MFFASVLKSGYVRPVVREVTMTAALGFTPQLHCSCGSALTIGGFYKKRAVSATGNSRQEFVCHHCGAVVRPLEE